MISIQSERPRTDLLVEGLIGVGLFALTLLVFSPCFDLPFANFDDPLYVTDNPVVRTGLTPAGIRWAFTNTRYFWHPLTWLSLELDSTLYGGLKAGGFHATNVLLHAASTVLLFLVLSRMTGAVWRSAIVAAFFAVHPLNVESVAWVAERKGALSTLFWMLTLAAYLGYVRSPGMLRYLLVVLFFLLGLMAKPMLVTLPFVLLLLDYWPLERMRATRGLVSNPAGVRSLRWLFVEKLPLFVLSLAGTVVAAIAEFEGGALPSLARFPFTSRVSNALLSFVAYLGKLIWPTQLAIHYAHPGGAVSVLHVVLAGLLLLGITLLVLLPGRRRPYLVVGWLWYLGTLVPVIGLIQIGTHGMADRYTYVPLIGIYVLLSWGCADLVKACHFPRLVPGVAVLAAIAVCSVLTWRQFGYWNSDILLWERAVAVSSDNSIAHTNLGKAFAHVGRTAEACDQYRQAIVLDPGLAAAHTNLAAALC